MLHPQLLLPRSIAALSLVLAVTACGDDEQSDDEQPSESAVVMDPGDGGVYAPEIDPSTFVAGIDNPLMPLPVGAQWHYAGESEGEPETVDITVTPDTKVVMGVTTVVVRDTVRVDGEIVEDTYDWFAQDADGNVWYFGEESNDFEDGELVSTEGSWEAGVDGAQPGIVMPAQPQAGAVIRQEYWPGEAEDMMEIAELDTELSVPAGSFDGVLVTRDWNPLEPEVVELKYYAPGVGRVREEVVGGDEVSELIEYALGA